MQPSSSSSFGIKTQSSLFLRLEKKTFIRTTKRGGGERVFERKQRGGRGRSVDVVVLVRGSKDDDDAYENVARLQRESEDLLRKQQLLLEQLEERKRLQKALLEKVARESTTSAKGVPWNSNNNSSGGGGNLSLIHI